MAAATIFIDIKCSSLILVGSVHGAPSPWPGELVQHAPPKSVPSLVVNLRRVNTSVPESRTSSSAGHTS